MNATLTIEPLDAPLGAEVHGADCARLDTSTAEALRPEFAYEHDWRVGDAVLWDNRCVVHARNDFSDQERRLFKRVTIR